MDADYKMAKEGLQNIQIDTVLPRMYPKCTLCLVVTAVNYV